MRDEWKTYLPAEPASIGVYTKWFLGLMMVTSNFSRRSRSCTMAAHPHPLPRMTSFFFCFTASEASAVLVGDVSLSGKSIDNTPPSESSTILVAFSRRKTRCGLGDRRRSRRFFVLADTFSGIQLLHGSALSMSPWTNPGWAPVSLAFSFSLPVSDFVLGDLLGSRGLDWFSGSM